MFQLKLERGCGPVLSLIKQQSVSVEVILLNWVIMKSSAAFLLGVVGNRSLYGSAPCSTVS